jgi:hypothetical protein
MRLFLQYLWICLCSGWLVIAEVRSRLDPNTGGADPEKFSEAIIKLGFSLVSKVCIVNVFCLSSWFRLL